MSRPFSRARIHRAAAGDRPAAGGHARGESEHEPGGDHPRGDDLGWVDEAARERLLAVLQQRGIDDARVLEAMAAVPRQFFVPEAHRAHAWDDTPLPIGHEQTISQPYIVALMAQALQLRADDRVLEVGGGCGYAAAVLGRLAGEVWSVERLQALCDSARDRLRRLGCDNVHMLCGDGSVGHAAAAPYDAIVVAAGGPEIPHALKAQLAQGGRLVMPVGSERTQQSLIRVTRLGNDAYEVEHLTEVRFVPLIGEQGWH